MIGKIFFMPGGDYGWSPFDRRSYFAEEFSAMENKNLTLEEKEKILISLQNKFKIVPKEYKNNVINTIKQTIRSINHNPLTTFPNNKKFNTFYSIEKFVKDQGNTVLYDKYVNAATTTRVGRDLYFGTVLEEEPLKNTEKYVSEVKKLISSYYRTHIVNSKTHSDSCFSVVKPGLIVSLSNVQNYEKTFPDWEIVYLPNQSWSKVDAFLKLKNKNQGKWWVPGEELNDDFTYFVETWLKDWVLYVEETVFDVNMLVIDEHNVVCNNYNRDVFNAFERHGITPHIINFRHRYFWDGGLHCITSDLSRRGTIQDYFPERNKK